MPTSELAEVTAQPLQPLRPPVLAGEAASLRRWLRETLAVLAAQLDERTLALRRVLVRLDGRLDEHADRLTSLELRIHRALPVQELPTEGPRGTLYVLAGDAAIYMAQGAGRPLLRFLPVLPL